MLYLIAFLEWFSTLCVEILAIRNVSGLVWTDSVTISIILWVILLALSYGYYKWWELCEKLDREAIISRLALNLCVSAFLYFFYSFAFQKVVLTYFISNWFYITWILITSLLLFFLPVFLASQSIPLLNQISTWNKSSEIWKILFYSTIGSFLWSFITSVAFFPTFWVKLTIILNSLILIFLSILISYFYDKKNKLIFYISAFIFFILIWFSYKKTDNYIFYKSNKYHDIWIYEIWEKRIFSLSGEYSSGINIDDKTSFFSYIREWFDNFSQQKWDDLEVLVLWWAWFTLPREISLLDNVKKIDVVDIDSDLKEISEKYFIQEKLNNKVLFHTFPSRFFVNEAIKNNQKYDFIFVDAYSWWLVPSQLWTYEFYSDLTAILKEKWEVNFNLILDINIDFDLSKNLLSSIKKAFPESYYLNVDAKNKGFTNYIVSNVRREDYAKNTFNNEVYFDDKTSIELDNLIFTRAYKTSNF